MEPSIRNGAAIGAIFLAALLAACAGGGNSNSSIPSGGTSGGDPIILPRAITPVSTASPGTFKLYALGSLNGGRIALGPDRLYFVNTSPKSIGWIEYDGTADSAPASPSDGAVPNGITEGVDGAMYFGEGAGSNLGKLVPNVTGGTVGTQTLWNDFGVTSAGTTNVISDQKGVLWYAEENNDSVVRMTTWGSLLTRTSLTSGAEPYGINVGPDGTVWVTELAGNRIAKLSSSGALLAEYSINTGSHPDDIATDSAGNAYFTEDVTGVQNYIGKVTPGGVISYEAAPNTGDLSGIVQGPDGNMWFCEHGAQAIVQYNVTTGVMTAHALPGGYGQPQGIVSGADGQLWFMSPTGGIASYHP